MINFGVPCKMSGYSKYLFAAVLASAALPATACTSWMIHPSLSATKRMIVHKCRDNRVTPLDADILRSCHGVKWMRLGANKEPLFAVSERGIATVMNDGDPMTLKHPNTDKKLKNARMTIISFIINYYFSFPISISYSYRFIC